MRVAIFGSWDWDNYSEIVRQLTVFIQEAHELEHDNITFVHSGSKGAENMITEYVGKTEKFLKQKNFKIKDQSIRGGIQVSKDFEIIESIPDYALIFSTGCKRTAGNAKLLKEYSVPFRIIESA